MELVVNVQKKAFKAENGEVRNYYSLTTEVEGVSISLTAKENDKKLLKHLLDKMDIPVESNDDKNALIDKLLSGEILTDAEKAKLKLYLGEEG